MGESDNIEDVGYLQDIISYIFDEKKIVTYKWISNVLSIHVNRAKQLLYTFIKHISEERLKELQVTYLVGGILPNDRGCRLQVVSEDDLEKVKEQFKVITSEHIYSVSLKNCLVDLANLCSVDGVKDSEVGRHGAVKCLKSIARTSQENASKRQGAYKSVEDDKKWPTAQTKPEKEISTGSNEKKSSKASNGISAMFAAQNGKKKAEETSPKKPDVKSAEKSSPEKKVPAPKNTSKGGKPPSNRLAAMFSAQNAKPKAAKKDVQEENKPKSDKENCEEDPKIPKNNSKLEEKHEKNTDSKNTQEKSSKTKTKSQSKKSKQKKRKASDNEEKSKKRKRIVMMDDSDSSDDDIFGSDKDEEEEEKSYLQPPPENEEEEKEETEKPTDVAAPEDSDPPAPDANVHHARKRHLVDKTFIDEEGYMVTKKVYEYVSCGESDSEGEKENEKASKSKSNKAESESKDNKSETESKKLKVEKQTSKTVQGPQKSLKNSNQKKNSSPEKKKQATLMTFFKRS